MNASTRSGSNTPVIISSKGSIIPLEKPVKTCKKWKLQVYLGKDKLTGKEVKKSRRFSGTKKEANRALREFIEELEEGIVEVDKAITFGKLAEAWLKDRKSSVRKGTYRKDKNNANNLRFYMENTRVYNINADLIIEVLGKLSSEGGRSGKPLSGATCQGIFISLNLIMKKAIKEKIVRNNPCSEVESRYRPKCDTREKDSLSLSEAQYLQGILLTGEPNSHKMGLLLALNCGLSREEFTGLTWADIDFTTHSLRVQYANTADGAELMTTKNDYRKRIIPLEASVYARLKEWKELQREKLYDQEICTGSDTPIVSNKVGEFTHPEAFGKWWRRYRKKIGLEGYTLHQLRHTYATILCASGVDIITASKLMGHCDTTMLSRIYAHMIPEYAREAANKVGSILNGESGMSPVPFVMNQEG